MAKSKVKEVAQDKDLCVTEVPAPGWSGLLCEHPEAMHDKITGKCSGHLEFGWGDYPCKCEKFKRKRGIMAKAKRKPSFCLHCGLQIEKSSYASGGWHHKISKSATCAPTAAIPDLGKKQSANHIIAAICQRFIDSSVENTDTRIKLAEQCGEDTGYKKGFAAGVNHIQQSLRVLLFSFQDAIGLIPEKSEE